MTGSMLLLLWSAGCVSIGFILGAVVMFVVFKWAVDAVVLPW